ncbi:MAG: APC family permease [Desulfovibrio sp.]|nr:APC family permease [Desulfovibrio sp.]
MAERLVKALSPLQVTSLALGSIVGWGCFILPGDSFLPNAGPYGAVIGFAIGALLMLFISVAYSYMIKYAPVAGGEFAYAYVGYGKLAAFICGWSLVIGYISIVMINVSAVSLIFRFLFPGIFQFGALYTIAGWQVYFGEILLGFALAMIFGYLNYRGISISGTVQVILAFMLSFGILGLFFGAASLDTATFDNLIPHFNENRGSLACILGIVGISPFLYVGFDTIPQSAEEFAFDPSRSRRIMIVAIIVGGLLYSLVTLANAIAIPYPDLLKQLDGMRTSSGHAWGTAVVATMAFGKFGAVVLACAVFGAVLSGINGFFVASTRLLLAMARARMLPDWFGKIHETNHTPSNAVIFVTGLALLTPFAGRSAVGWTVDMSAVGTAIGYLFTCIVATKILRSEVQNSGMGRFICVLGTLSSLICLVLLLCPGSPSLIGPMPQLVLGIWVLLGVIFYLMTKNTWMNLPEDEMKMGILGNTTTKVFFK